MSISSLTVAERNHIKRAHSQAVYYAQRGFYDACRIHCHDMTPEMRSRLTGVVGAFIEQYIISELAYLVNGGEVDASDGLTRIAKPDF